MRLLILGGTQFLGRHVAELALDRGDEVTLFNRGQTNPGLFADRAEIVIGDRDGGLEGLAGREFDVCVDPSGYVPRLVDASTALLADSVDHYIFVSSISAYPLFTPGMDETGTEAELDDPTVEVVDGDTYGGLKVLCERAAEANMPGRVTQVRAGLIVGPNDPTDRFTYWPVRYARGGRFVAPVGAETPIQFIDVRDLSAWMLHAADERIAGTFNVTGRVSSYGELFAACEAVSGSGAEPVWLDESTLLDSGVAPWQDLPMWLPERALGMNQVSIERALANGLAFRDAESTIRDTLAWHATRESGALLCGLAPEREDALLAG